MLVHGLRNRASLRIEHQQRSIDRSGETLGYRHELGRDALAAIGRMDEELLDLCTVARVLLAARFELHRADEPSIDLGGPKVKVASE